MNFDEVIQLQVLKLKAVTHGRHGRIIDSILDQGEVPGIRQLCAKVPQQIHDRLDTVTNILDMSKREFVEAALVDALERAEQTISRSGALDVQGSL